MLKAAPGRNQYGGYTVCFPMGKESILMSALRDQVVEMQSVIPPEKRQSVKWWAEDCWHIDGFGWWPLAEEPPGPGKKVTLLCWKGRS